MVLTRSQYKNMLKEELIEQLVSHDDIATKLSELTKRFDSLLLEHVYQVEHNAVSNLQHHRRETLEINPVP